MSIGGVKLDLGKVKLPVYELCAKEDHIAPAKSVFIGAQLFGGPVEYVLAGSGHIAGVINPPATRSSTSTGPATSSRRRSRLGWRAPRSIPAPGGRTTPIGWHKQSGYKMPPRKPGAKLGAIEDAPGSYVRSKA